MNLNFLRELPNPDAIKALLPTTAEQKAIKARRDGEIREILSGNDDKFLLIVGPCSADRQDAVLDYISRLRKVQEQALHCFPRILPKRVQRSYPYPGVRSG